MTENPPKLSIIITTYNRSRILSEISLPSALNQISSQRFEIIVIDDCSTDDTEQTVRKFQKQSDKIRYHKQDKNKGLAAARNIGASIALGEYIVFLDDDDMLVPYVLEIGNILLDKYSESKAVIGARLILYPEGTTHQQPPILSDKSLYTTLDDGFVIRKDVFKEIQYDEELLTNEDADFGIQFMQKYGYKSVIPVNNVLLVKSGHKVGAKDSWSSPSERTFLGMERYMKKNLPIYYKHGDNNETEYILRYMGRLYCQGGRMKDGIQYLWKAFRLKPMHKNFFLLFFALGGSNIFNWYYKQYAKASRTKI